MTCPACQAAKNDPLHHEYASGCDSCLARTVAAIGLHTDSINAGKVLPEMARVLRSLFKDPNAGWTLVREWGVKVDKARKHK